MGKVPVFGVWVDLSDVEGQRWKLVARLEQRLGFLRNRFPGRKPLQLLIELARELEDRARVRGSISILAETASEELNDRRQAEVWFGYAMELRNLADRLELCRRELRR